MDAATAEIQPHCAVAVLTEKFREVIRARIPQHAADNTDFKACLRVLKENVHVLFPVAHEAPGVCKQLDRALRIPHEYQSFPQFQHLIECLRKLSAFFGLEPSRFRLPIDCDDVKDWKMMKIRGDELCRQEEWTKAFTCYTIAIGLNPEAAALYSNRARCELEMGLFDVAKIDAEDAIELDPKKVGHFTKLSQALFGLELYQETAEACIAGLHMDPSDEGLKHMLRNARARQVGEETEDVFEAMKNMDIGKVSTEKKKYGDKYTAFLFGLNYFEGSNGFGKDLVKAEEKLRKAAQLGHPLAGFVLGKLLLTKKENEEAFVLINQAAQMGNTDAMFTLGNLLAYGHGCPKNEKEARRWLRCSGLYHDSREMEKHMHFAKRVVEYEKAKKLDIDELTYQERMSRFVARDLAQMPKEKARYVKDKLKKAFRGHTAATVEGRLLTDATLDSWSTANCAVPGEKTARASCGNCGTAFSKLSMCGRCKRVSYCGRDCQRQHWPVHKQACK